QKAMERGFGHFRIDEPVEEFSAFWNQARLPKSPIRGHGQRPERRATQGDWWRVDRVLHGEHFSRARGIRKGGVAACQQVNNAVARTEVFLNKRVVATVYG